MQHAIDLETEPLLMLSDCKQAGIDRSYRTLLRYVRQGVRRGQRRIHLECVRLPTGMATSLEAYHRFITQLTEAQS